MRIRIFSLQRSGSNYLEYLLAQNYDVDVVGRVGSEKHFRYEDVDVQEPTIHIARNPLTWVASFHNFRHHFTWYTEKETFDDLIPRYAEIYNDMNRQWHEACTARMRYEQAMLGEKGVSVLAEHIGLARKDQEWVDTNRRMTMQATPSRKPHVRRKSFSATHMDNFKELLNKDLLERIGYSI